MKFLMGLVFHVIAFALWADGVTNVNWSGFYVGGNLGGIWSQFQGNVTDSTYVDRFGITIPAFALPFNANQSSFIAGGQIGYNWIRNHIVWGTEVGFSGVNFNKSHSVNINETGQANNVFKAGDHFSSQINWQGSWVAHLGMTTEQWMFYSLGGVAFTGATLSTNIISIIIDGDKYPSAAGSNSKTLVGGTVGVGTEYVILSNLRVGLEYRYSDYGKKSYNVGTNPVSKPPNSGFIFTPLTANMRLSTNQVVARLNYALNT